jgi:murein DD-endopeptidase MepM/ murein hydrolase activator NlpD
MHTGIDIGIPKNNKIVAANAGTVIMASWYSGYGNTVIIDHGGGIATLYAHNTSLKVKKGDKVTKGQQVAASGSTGQSTGPHLHFEVRVGGKYKDPMGYL